MSPSARAESHLLKRRRHRLTRLQAQDFMWSSETVAYFEGLFILQLQIKTFKDSFTAVYDKHDHECVCVTPQTAA